MRGLRRNPMRAMLAALGIIIGVGAVIAMMEIGNGVASANNRTIASLGANTVMIQPGQANSAGGMPFGSGNAMTLSPQDADAIARECSAVKQAPDGSVAVAPLVRARVTVVYGNMNWVPQQISGTTAEYLTVRDWSVSDGDTFTDRDVSNANKVCLVGQTLVRELFGGRSPVGEQIRLKNVSFKVVGALSAKGANMMGMDQDDIVLAPWTTIKYRVTGQSASTANQSAASSASTAVNTLDQIYPGGASVFPARSDVQQADTPTPVRFANVDQIMVAARSAQDIPLLIRQMTSLLRERHRVKDQQDDFNIRDMAEFTNAFTQVSDRMTQLLTAVASISLLVGGVGIMNIMLVSVTERTHEIGLRMAVGARAGDILRQFLVEAVSLCTIGGALGILLGVGVSYFATKIGLPTETSITAIVLSVAISAFIGIVFGFYPAWKASRLDPIDALRYE
jgi:ABC-type antimicrobial peptide transport system permease subunit